MLVSHSINTSMPGILAFTPKPLTCAWTRVNRELDTRAKPTWGRASRIIELDIDVIRGIQKETIHVLP